MIVATKIIPFAAGGEWLDVKENDQKDENDTKGCSGGGHSFEEIREFVEFRPRWLVAHEEDRVSSIRKDLFPENYNPEGGHRCPRTVPLSSSLTTLTGCGRI